MAYAINTGAGKKTERKKLITVVDWAEGSGSSAVHHSVILGVRTEDSSIDFNPDIQTSTDILGINYTDFNKTQPSQQFDPHYIIGGDLLTARLNEAIFENKLDMLNNAFDAYIVEVYNSEETTGSTTTTKYRTIKHSGCTISADSVGGSVDLNMPITVYYSNEITLGSVSGYDKATLEEINTNFTAD